MTEIKFFCFVYFFEWPFYTGFTVFYFLFPADCGEAGTKKKKACKNCTCGLAEELDAEAEEKQKSKTVTSSCGSVCDLFVYLCLVVTCWERADLLAVVIGV